MKKLTIMIASLAFLSGCATSGLSERMDALETQLGQLEGSTADALQMARRAQADAAAAGDAGTAAQSAADRALAAAEQAAERANRISEECCVRK